MYTYYIQCSDKDAPKELIKSRHMIGYQCVIIVD